MKTITILINVLFIVFCVQAYAADSPHVSEPVKKSTRINLNKANEQMLRSSFKGIGKRRAAAIVAYRSEHGEFTSVAELAKVKSMGKPFVSKHLSELEQIFFVSDERST